MLESGDPIYVEIAIFIVQIAILISKMDSAPLITPGHPDYAIPTTSNYNFNNFSLILAREIAKKWVRTALYFTPPKRVAPLTLHNDDSL